MQNPTVANFFFCFLFSFFFSVLARTRPISSIRDTSRTTKGFHNGGYSTTEATVTVPEKWNCSTSAFDACINKVLAKMESDFPTNLNESMDECRLFYESVDCINAYTTNCDLGEKKSSMFQRKVQPAMALFPKLCGEPNTQERYYMQGACFLKAKEKLDICTQNYRSKSRNSGAQGCCVKEEVLSCIEAAILSEGCGKEAVKVAKENALIVLGMDPSMETHSCGSSCVVEPPHFSGGSWLHHTLYADIVVRVMVILLAYS